MFIGAHCDYLHLTHHLLPGIPFWNLKKATEILREDNEFEVWDDQWGGIFSSRGDKRINFDKLCG
ncbi:fatty acid desaturase [Deefgea sp. CFH1-16]|uniref:fatty acid desaturase n=1 Tax=Deefgea sp. CFH1-16 TaxID=2675457 RepID=UPI00194036E3